MDLGPLPGLSALTKNRMGAGEQERCGASEGFSSGQPGVCGKVLSTGGGHQLNPSLQCGGHQVLGLKAQSVQQVCDAATG